MLEIEMLKSKLFYLLFLLIFMLPLFSIHAEEGADPNFAKLDQVFSQAGKDLPGGVRRYAWPRTDLRVTLDGVVIEPGLALGSWAGFQQGEKAGELMTMGDLVLRPSEMPAVIDQLQAGGIDVAAIHNHLTGESPEIIYVHFTGHGAAEALASTLKNALTKTGSPVPAVSKPPAAPAPAATKSFETVQRILGAEGNVSGAVLQIGIPRKEKIEENATEVPASMGMANVMNFQIADNRVASTGDFVLIASEVNPVIKELRAHGIRVTALHTHMLNDSPRLFFMHFWALDTPEKVAQGLKAALSKINVELLQ